jgi:hypothetical protein
MRQLTQLTVTVQSTRPALRQYLVSRSHLQTPWYRASQQIYRVPRSTAVINIRSSLMVCPQALATNSAVARPRSTGQETKRMHHWQATVAVRHCFCKLRWPSWHTQRVPTTAVNPLIQVTTHNAYAPAAHTHCTRCYMHNGCAHT